MNQPTDGTTAERERIETEEVLLDLAQYVGDPDGIGGLAVLECQWCHAAFTVDCGLNLEAHEAGCGFRRVAEAALSTVDAGRRTETFYVNPYDLRPFNLAADYFSILFRQSPSPHLGSPVQLSWDATEDTDD